MFYVTGICTSDICGSSHDCQPETMKPTLHDKIKVCFFNPYFRQSYGLSPFSIDMLFYPVFRQSLRTLLPQSPKFLLCLVVSLLVFLWDNYFTDRCSIALEEKTVVYRIVGLYPCFHRLCAFAFYWCTDFFTIHPGTWQLRGHCFYRNIGQGFISC